MIPKKLHRPKRAMVQITTYGWGTRFRVFKIELIPDNFREDPDYMRILGVSIGPLEVIFDAKWGD